MLVSTNHKQNVIADARFFDSAALGDRSHGRAGAGRISSLRQAEGRLFDRLRTGSAGSDDHPSKPKPGLPGTPTDARKTAQLVKEPFSSPSLFLIVRKRTGNCTLLFYDD